MIDLLKTRNPEEIQNELNKYENLSIISRDRGFSYRSLSKHCIHIADRFHLVMNFSSEIIKEIKRTLPRQVNLKSAMKSSNSNLSENKNKIYTDKQLKKQKLIKEIREGYSKGKSKKDLTKEYKLNFRTVTKYIELTDVYEIQV